MARLGGIERWFMTRSKHGRCTMERAEKLLSLIDRRGGERFLEVGCGAGAVSKYMAEEFELDVTAVDIDPDMLRRAKEGADEALRIHLLAADATTLPFKDDCFDLVLSFGVMHHIRNWTHAMEEIVRVLRSNGHIIFWDIVYSDPGAKIIRPMAGSFGVPTMPEIRSFFRDSGLRTIHSERLRRTFPGQYEAVLVLDMPGK